MLIDELDLALQVGPGRGPAPLWAGDSRPLTEADMALLAVREDCPTAKPPALKTIRETHHRLAQALARGATGTDAARAVGYSVSRVSILQKDPAFSELIAHYKEVQQEIFIDVEARMKGLALDAVSALQERLDEEPEQFSNKELTELAKVSSDRGGNAPRSRHDVNVTELVVDAAELAKMKQKAKEDQLGDIKTVAQDAEGGQGDRAAALGYVVGQPALIAPETDESEAEGQSSQGQII